MTTINVSDDVFDGTITITTYEGEGTLEDDER